MEKRQLGKTGLSLSIIGFGGFHLIETPLSESKKLLNYYLDNGGNYVETAADYGDGISERKIGQSISHRRNDFILASKCARRSNDETQKSIERSLKNLNTDYLDILFMHAVQSKKEVEQIHGSGGAMEAALKARQKGKVRFIALSGHGEPEALRYAVSKRGYDVLMTGFNYFDRFNFPATENKLLPECLDKDMGVLAMKALADGYLYRTWEQGIRYSLSLPVTSLVLGINTMEYLKNDLAIAENFSPMSSEEKEELYTNAMELGNYVCRQCKKCDGQTKFTPSQIFELEGIFDRQMEDGFIPDPAFYALRERLKHWFAQQGKAMVRYAALPEKVNPETDYSFLNPTCPYHIDIDRKLKMAHAKLGGTEYLF